MKLKSADELKQRHVVAFTRAVREMKPGEVSNIIHLPLPEYYDVTLKAAVKAGWFGDSLTVQAVDEMRPAETREPALAVWDLYEAVTAVDPN